jgi:hypothetical protein
MDKIRKEIEWNIEKYSSEMATDEIVIIMETFAREKVKEFILFYNNRQSKVNTIALKDEMELFYDEN